MKDEGGRMNERQFIVHRSEFIVKESNHAESKTWK
jgi:hypothetical protein